jgi:hypothetical protein
LSNEGFLNLPVTSQAQPKSCLASKKLKFAEGPSGVNSQQSVEVVPSEFLIVHANDLSTSLAWQFPARAEAEHASRPASAHSIAVAQRAGDFAMVRDPPAHRYGIWAR